MYNKDYDALIAKFQQEISKLETERSDEDKRIEGLNKFDDQLTSFYQQYKLNDEDMFVFKGDDLLSTLKTIEKRDERPALFEDLKVYFSKVIDKEGARRKRGTGSAKPATGPKLAVGTYTNPHSGETFEKIKRNPKGLDNWLEEFGFDTVSSWIQ